MSKEYYVENDDNTVSISLKPINKECGSPLLDFYLDAFINISVDIDGTVDSPFKNIDDAKIFAEAIVKLLKSVEVFIDDIE